MRARLSRRPSEEHGEFSTLGQIGEDGAEGKLIKGHQRELACGRDEIKECRLFVARRPLSAAA